MTHLTPTQYDEKHGLRMTRQVLRSYGIGEPPERFQEPVSGLELPCSLRGWCTDHRSSSVPRLTPPRRWGVLFTGVVGSGKTTMATELLKTGPPEALWVQVPDYLRAVKASWEDRDTDSGELAACLQRYIYPVLLDDLGAERETAWASDLVAQILVARHSHQLPTIVTTNLSHQQLRVWEPRVASRLIDDGRTIHLSSGNRRQRQGDDDV